MSSDVNECKPLAGGGVRARHRVAGARRPAAARGRAVQVDPIKPTLKAPESKPLKLEHEKTLSIFAFKFYLRHYSEALKLVGLVGAEGLCGMEVVEAGAYTRSLFSST